MQVSTNEVWKQVPEFPFLEASNLGRIARRDVLPNIIVKQHLNKTLGYYMVTLNIDTPQGRKQCHRYVHRLVLSAFEGIPPGKAEVNHIDGNKLNNLLSNLEWTDRAGNAKHAWATGLQTAAKPKLFEHLDNILTMIRSGKTYTEIEKHYKVRTGTISYLLNASKAFEGVGIEKPDRLAERRNQVVQLRDNKGLTFNEIAEQLNISFWQAYNLYRYRNGYGE